MPLLSSGFVGLGESLADKAKGALSMVQGVLTPSAKPVNTSSFSFDFSAMTKKLLSPFQNRNVTNAIKDSTAGVIRAAGSSIETIFRNSNSKPEQTSQIATSPSNSIPSQTNSDLSSILSAFAGKIANPAIDAQQVSLQASEVAQRNILIVGAGVLLLTVLSLSRSK